MGPALMVFDWELAGWGIPGTDLAQFIGGVVSPDLSAYCSVLRPSYPHLSVEFLERVAAFGNLLRLVDDISWEAVMLEFGPRIFLIGPIMSLEKYDTRFVTALRNLGWSNTS